MTLDITKLISEGEKVEYKGQTFQVRPLSVREQGKFAELQQAGKMGDASEFLFVSTLKKTNPDLTEEQILSIEDPEFIKVLTKKILQVNGLSTPKENFPQESQSTQQKQ